MNDVISDNPFDEAYDKRWPWFVSRMLSDEWFFGLYLTDGRLLGCTHLNSVKVLHGETWLDVELMGESSGAADVDMVVAPTSRLTASVNAKHVMYVVELADT